MPEPRRLHLPEFCAPRAVLTVLLVVALTALLLALSRAGIGPGFWIELARTAFFLVWVGLGSAAALCAARRPLARLSVPAASIAVMLIVAVLVALVSEASFRLGAGLPAGAEPATGGLFPRERWPFLTRNVAIGLLVAAIVVRYFYIRQQWRLNVESQALARVNALQARIRPHFLYNSMNTIAALTRSDPAQAERAVEDLADLFRASLGDQRARITLAEELEVARTYQRIEQLRLGARLCVEWDVDALPQDALLPGLTLQPLLENAIGHGIEPLPEGGTVRIEGHAEGGSLFLQVRNPLALEATGRHLRQGHGLALDNIGERLALLYGGAATLETGRQGDEFVVQLRFPLRSAAGADDPTDADGADA